MSVALFVSSPVTSTLFSVRNPMPERRSAAESANSPHSSDDRPSANETSKSYFIISSY